jgi:hypothetical protein
LKESNRRIEENNKFIFKRFFKYLKSKYYKKHTEVKSQMFEDFFKFTFTENEFALMFEGDIKKGSKSKEK